MSGVLENGTTTLASYDYDATSRRTDLTYGDTTSASYGYAANNDLTGLTQSFTGSSVSFTYGYNAVGQRTSVNVSNSSFLYHPPSASSVSYAPNSVNQYTTVGASSLTYDGNGNLTGDGVASYGYDTENHLTSASALGNTIAYAYDPLGRRASKTVNATVTTFVSAGNQEIADYDGSGTLLRRYVYGVGLDEPIVTITINGATATKAYNHQDGLGSVVALSDGATGAVSDIYAYGPYGQSASLAGNAFRFTGRRLDAESGLYYYRARYYSPRLGRFLQTDPIGTSGGINLYAYATNDPLNNVDPTGLWGIFGSFGLTAVLGSGPYVAAIATNSNTGAQYQINGVVATEQVGSGAFINNTGSVNAGAFVTSQAEITGLTPSGNSVVASAQPTPSGVANGVLGGSIGLGKGFGVTTANSAADLFGPAHVTQLDLGLISLQYSVGHSSNGTPIYSWSVGGTLGLGFSSYDTNTASISVPRK